LEISVHFEMAGTRLRLVGYSGLTTDARGGYLGNTFAPGWDRRIPLACPGADSEGGSWLGARVPRFYHALRPVLEEALRQEGYEGPVGIDAMAYRDASGRCRWKPVVEMNPRYTMGRLTLALAERVMPGRYGRFQLFRRSDLRRTGHPGFAEWASDLRSRRPVVLEGEPVPRLSEGALCLNDPETAKACVAVLTVDPRPGE
ncbi:MAG: hypothetical protein IT580_22925, partial [Verrucomicrobiales bacterium]|nr:hypothetical protein [Verrucomicrobiales bacterium]